MKNLARAFLFDLNGTEVDDKEYQEHYLFDQHMEQWSVERRRRYQKNAIPRLKWIAVRIDFLNGQRQRKPKWVLVRQGCL
jgi:hypothetical protein